MGIERQFHRQIYSGRDRENHGKAQHPSEIPLIEKKKLGRLRIFVPGTWTDNDSRFSVRPIKLNHVSGHDVVPLADQPLTPFIDNRSRGGGTSKAAFRRDKREARMRARRG